jgi:hypothetical protein
MKKYLLGCKNPSKYYKKELTKNNINDIIKSSTERRIKTMTKDEMLTLVVQRWGFEHEYTIQFAEAMEWMGQTELEALLNEVLDLPLDIEVEWD